MATRKNRYWLALIILIGLALRLYPHAEFGPGGVTFVGTCGQLIDEVKPLVSSGNLLNFEVFFYPPVAPLIVAGTAKIVSAIIPGFFDLNLHCLFITILFSTVTIVVLYHIGREWSPTVGLLAAAFYSVTMIAVDSANNVQVYSAFFTLMAIYFFYKSQNERSWKNLIFMGVTLGLAIGSKYFPVVLIPMFFILHFATNRIPAAAMSRDSILKGAKTLTVNFQAFLLNTSLSILVLASLVILYFGIFHQQSSLRLFKGIYDASSHEHPFEYHLSSIQRMIHLGLLCIGGVGICAASFILIPTIRGRSSWEWAREYVHRNEIWIVPSVSMIATLLITIGIPAIFNLSRYAAYTVWMVNAYASADGGMFPAGSPAPSYFISFFPENLGIPLFVIGCAGLSYCLFSRDRKAILLLFIVLPLYLMLERSSVKVNRYALELMPIFCLFAAISLDRLRQSKRMIWRVITIGLCLTILNYSTLYVLAWANVTRQDRDVRIETAEWIKSHVSAGSRIGMNGRLWVASSPELIPDRTMLSGYTIADYTSFPEYVVIPKLLLEVVSQYDRLTKIGYAYREQDWTPQSPPPLEELDALINIVNQQQYVLVKEFEKFPSFAGVSFGYQRFGRRTWLREHASAYGIQIYQKRQSSG